MRKKSNKISHASYFGNQNTSFATLLNALDPEREAQRQEHLNQKKENTPRASTKKPQKTSQSSSKLKGMSFEEKLERTKQWLEETFPALFDPSQPCKALDVHIVRDIKIYYKREHVKKKYPNDLVIKAALYRYMKSPPYLECLVEGAPRYNIEGKIMGTV